MTRPWRVLLVLTAMLVAGASHAQIPDPDDARRPKAPLHEEVITAAGDPAL